ncbi:MAG: hypothetical protein AAB588_01675 [Patescibacteria group bacterium]
MLWPWIIAILIVFALIILATILASQAQEVSHREHILMELLWSRRHRIPLLLEQSALLPGLKLESQKIIDLRAKVSTGQMSLLEEVQLEKQLTDLLAGSFRQIESSAGSKANSNLLSLKQEFQDLLEKTRIALNDYNFSLQKFQRSTRLPWYKVFEFAFPVRHSKVLPPV